MGRLMSFLRPYRTMVALVLILTFAQTLASLYLPNLMSSIVDRGVLRGDVAYILAIGALMLGVALVSGAAAVLASLFGAKATAGFSRDLRNRLFRHVENFTLREFNQIGTSSLIVRTTNDVMKVQQLVGMSLRVLVMAPLTAIGGIIMAVATDASLAPVLVVALPVMAAVIYLVMGRGFGLFRTIQVKVDRLNLVLRENLTGVRVVRAFGRTPYELDRFRAANEDLTDTSVRVFRLMATMMPAIMLVMNLATVAIVWFGGVQVEAGTLPIGKLMAFIQYVTQILFAVMMVSFMLFMVPRGQASAVRILEVLDMEPEIRAPGHAGVPPEAKGRVEFRDVTFRYPGAEAPALEHVSFAAEPGQMTAIIGGTGSGKSTLMHLILRFYDVASGAVLVDGVDVREMSQAELRSRIGYVPQRAVLFTGSVTDNLRYGDLEVTKERARHVLDVAQATEFVDAMPEGMDAGVMQGGTNLSGGQRQRLSIARALARRASIYLFDDSFSALDYKTDAALRQALRREVRNSAVLVVAQRVSTVMDADRIVVLDDGEVVGVGRHGELMRTCPVYQEIVASQMTPEESA